MDIVAMRVFIYSLLPVITAAVHVALDKSIRSRERILETFLCISLALVWQVVGLVDFSPTSSFRIR
jgi:hypothetical protein